MSYQFNFDDHQILNHKFSPALKGYDALEVDRFFDSVLKDYQEMRRLVTILKKLESDNLRLKGQNSDLEARLKSIENRLAHYEKLNGDHRDNFENMRRMAAYEKFLWSLGYDPQKIK